MKQDPWDQWISKTLKFVHSIFFNHDIQVPRPVTFAFTFITGKAQKRQSEIIRPVQADALKGWKNWKT